jgi:hypothetical protein
MRSVERRGQTIPRVTFLSAVLGAAAAAGCGDVHGIQIDKVATDIGQTVCTAAYRCCTLDQLMNNSSAGTDASDTTMPAKDCTMNTATCEQACEQETTQNYRQQLSAVQTSVNQKRATYEQAKVDACLQTIRQSDCSTLNMTNHLTGVPGCESFTTPLVNAGGACGNDYECITGWCKFPATGGGDGVCTMPNVGMSCATDSCGQGMVCDTRGTGDQSDDICVAPADNGMPCTDSATCKSNNCSSSGGSGMTCQPSTAAMCFYSGGCASGGGGRPGVATILLLAAFAVVALARARRRGAGRQR